MAIVGSAEIIVRAVTKNVKDDIRKGLSGLDGIGNDAGDGVGDSFSKGFARGFGRNAGEILDLGKVLKEADAAREQFANLQRASFALGAGLTALGGVIGALVGGIGILIVTAAAASPVLVGLGSIFAAVAVSAGVLRAVFSGVGEAIQSQIKGTSAATDAADALAAAELRVADAKYALNELTKQQARDIAELEERYRDSTDAEADAAIAAERAERNYQSSVKATEKALEDVTQAREEAKEAIQQLRFELEGGVISEKKARLEFEKARESLQRVQDLPPNSRARREAELAFAEADLNLRRAIDKNGDLRKATTKANREGVDGNAKVVKAQESLQKSIQSQQDAEIDAAKAVRGYNEAVEDRIAVEDELKKNSAFYEKQRRDLELADRAVTQAMKDAAKAAKEYNTALKEDPYINLSPSAKEFVDYIVSLKDRLNELKKVLQEAFFKEFNDGAKLFIETYLPVLEAKLPLIAKALGEVASNFAKAFAKPERVADIETILDSIPELVTNYGTALSNLAETFTVLLAEFSPFAIEFSQYVKDLTTGWLETIELKRETGELQAAFETATGIMYSLYRSIGNFLGGIGNTIKATFSEGGGGWYFLDWLEQVTEKWEQFTKKGAADGSLDKYILGLSTSFTTLLATIGLIAKGFLDIAATEGFNDFLTKVNDAIRIFNEIGLDIANNALPAVGDFILAFAKLTKLFFDAESIKLFFGTLAGAIEVVVALLDNEFGRALISGIGAIVAVGLAFGLLQKVFSFFGKILLSVSASMVRLFSFIMPAGSTAAATLRGAMTALAAGNLAAAWPVLAVVAAIAALVAIFKLAYDNSEFLRDTISGLVKVFKDVFAKTLEDLGKSFETVFGKGENLRKFFQKLGDILALVIGPVVGFIGGLLIGTLGGAIDTVIRALGALKNVFEFVFNFFKTIVGVFIGVFTGKWDTALEGLKGGLKSFQAFFGNIFSAILTPFRGAINGIIDAWNSVARRFTIKVPKWIPFIGGNVWKFDEVDRIPGFAKGGTIYPTTGGTLARIAEAGRPERIEPLDPDGLSKRDKAMIEMLAGNSQGINITVNPSPGMDERELAALVSRQLAFQLRKGAA
jgi:phage-related protein